MKKYIVSLLLFCPVFIQAQTSIMADYASYCNDTNNDRIKEENIFGNYATLYNGVTYLFRFNTELYCIDNTEPVGYDNGCPCVYNYYPSSDVAWALDLQGDVNKCDKRWNPCITYFKYPYERQYTPKLLANVFTFNYNGRLWYSQTIESKDKKSYYECFAELPTTNHTKAFTYYISTTISSGSDAVPVKMGAFQMGSDLYFISNMVLYNDQTSLLSDWWLQKYSYNSNTNKFDWVSNTMLGPPVPVFGGLLGGLFRRNDPVTGQDYIVFSTYDNNKNLYLYSLKFADNSYQISSLYSILHPIPVGGLAVVPGSIQGKRQPSNVLKSDSSDRFTMFTINPSKVGSDYPIFAMEYYFDPTGMPHYIDSYQISNPIGYGPKQMNSFFSLAGTYTLEPHHYTNKLSSSSSYSDGYQQKVWLFFTDTKQDIFGVGFNSDIWQPSPSNSDTIFTSNLVSDTGTIASELQSMSTLVGIVDGGPPCSVDWEKWDSAFPPGGQLAKDPTALELSTSSTQKIEYTNTTNDEFTTGLNMEFSQDLEVAEVPLSIDEGVGFHYVHAFKTMYTTGIETVNKWTTSFPLQNVTQNQGCYIWAVPSITRYVYRRYPWWDASPYTTYKYPVPNSLQYLFRVTGINYLIKGMPITGFPFRVGDPNGKRLRDWTVDSVLYGKPGRQEIFQVLFDNPALSRLTNSTWTAPWNAENGTFESMVDTTLSNETENKFNLEVTAGMKVPAVFKMEASAGYDISYSAEVKSTSSFGHEIQLAINLNGDVTNFINNKNSLNIDLYMFKSTDGINYWYWDSIPTPSQKPWYIAYVISSAAKKISLISPENNYAMKEPGLLFSWKPENMESCSSRFYISRSWPITPATVVYEEKTGGQNIANPVNFKPEPGKTYTWAVRATDASGAIIWSDPRTFSVPQEETAVEESGLKALIYPNPGDGRNITIAFITKDPGIVLLSLYEMNGRCIFTNPYENEGNKLILYTLPPLDIRQGVYLAEIRAGGERIVKKLVIF